MKRYNESRESMELSANLLKSNYIMYKLSIIYSDLWRLTPIFLINGDLKLKGELKPWDDSLPENGSIRKFIIRSGNNNTTDVFIIDKDGNLYLKGLVFIHSLL